MMKIHTPGPWGQKATMSSDFRHIRFIVANGVTIADVRYENRDQDENLANSTLIAAAPSMLDALAECITEDGAHCLDYGTDTPTMRKRFAEINRIARATIARATGED